MTKARRFSSFTKCVSTLASAETAPADRLLENTLRDALRNREGALITALSSVDRRFSLDPGNQGQMVSLLSQSFPNTADPELFGSLLNLTLMLPSENADTVLGVALPLAPTPELRSGILAARERIRNGDHSLLRLRQALTGSKED